VAQSDTALSVRERSLVPRVLSYPPSLSLAREKPPHVQTLLFTKTATDSEGLEYRLPNDCDAMSGHCFAGNKEGNDWEIYYFQLRFMVLYAIRNEISRFRVVKTRKRKIDIEIFCSLLS